MSFTADELQSFNDILEKKLSAHRREMERIFDQRIQTLRRELERSLNTLQQEIIQTFTQRQAEQQRGLQTTLSQQFNTQQLSIAQTVSNELRLRQQQQPQIESLMDRALAAQLLAIDELLNQRLTLQTLDESSTQVGDQPPHYKAIEVQTELPWEDLLDIFGKALDERFVKLYEITQTTMGNWEQNFIAQLQILLSQVQVGATHAGQMQDNNSNLTDMQEVFQRIEQLERIIESIQVAMTANHALISNRLYQHQQLPLERAHTSTRLSPPTAHPNGTSTGGPLSLPEERAGK